MVYLHQADAPGPHNPPATGAAFEPPMADTWGFRQTDPPSLIHQYIHACGRYKLKQSLIHGLVATHIQQCEDGLLAEVVVHVNLHQTLVGKRQSQLVKHIVLGSRRQGKQGAAVIFALMAHGTVSAGPLTVIADDAESGR